MGGGWLACIYVTQEYRVDASALFDGIVSGSRNVGAKGEDFVCYK
jgi:hypothetical protein